MVEIADWISGFLSHNAMPEETAKKLLEGARVATFRRKECFINQNGPCRYVGAILDGIFEFKICRTDGEEQLIGYSFTSDFMTDYPAFLNQTKAHYTIRAICDSSVLLFPYDHVMDCFESDMEGQRFGRQIAERLMIQREERLLSFYADTPEERYLKILSICKELPMQITLKDIASMIRVTPETVSRIRKKILLESKS